MLITEVIRRLSKSKLAAFITMTTMGHGDSNWGKEVGNMMNRADAQAQYDTNMKRINNRKAKLIAHILKNKRKGNQR